MLIYEVKLQSGWTRIRTATIKKLLNWTARHNITEYRPVIIMTPFEVESGKTLPYIY